MTLQVSANQVGTFTSLYKLVRKFSSLSRGSHGLISNVARKLVTSLWRRGQVRDRSKTSL